LCVYKNNSSYEGGWILGVRHGEGEHCYSHGDVFNGTFDMDNMVSGRFGDPKNPKYVGCFEGATMHGKGIFTFPSGDTYCIEISSTYTIRYEGEFTRGSMTGNGVYRCTNGTIYVGACKDQKKHGLGTMRYPNGGIYSGEYDQNKKHGKGYFQWPDGDVYHGVWKNNRRFGPGILHTRDIVIDVDWKESDQEYKDLLPPKFPFDHQERDKRQFKRARIDG